MRIKACRSNGKAEVIVKADDSVCPEFNSTVTANGAFCCWIPVKTSQKIAVECSWNGTTSETQFDLILDGTLRNSFKKIDKYEKSGRRSVRFKTAFFVESKNIPLEADMVVRDLALNGCSTIQRPGLDMVGKIEVQISVLRHHQEARHHLDENIKAYDTVGSWKNDVSTLCYTGIQPTQELDLVQVEPQPKNTSFTKLDQRSTTNRSGQQPWAVLKFYYRTHGKQNSYYFA
jgi:hypothetical protein